MGQLAFKIAVGIITLCIGIGLSALLDRGAYRLSSGGSWNLDRSISLCDVESDPSPYLGKKISIRTFLDLDFGKSIDEPDKRYFTAISVCGGSAYATSTIEFTVDPRERGLDTRERLITKRGVTTSQPIRVAEVTIVGELDPTVGPGCWAPKFRISNASVKDISLKREFENGRQLYDWLELISH
jgi:hypothetical protein